MIHFDQKISLQMNRMTQKSNNDDSCFTSLLHYCFQVGEREELEGEVNKGGGGEEKVHEAKVEEVDLRMKDVDKVEVEEMDWFDLLSE